MNRKEKILIIVGGIWEPAISIAGTKILYKLIKKLSQKNQHIHLLTTVSSWTDKDYINWYTTKEKELGIKFHFIKTTLFEKIPVLNLIITRLQLLVKTYALNKKYNFYLVHDFVSSTLLFFSSFFYKKIMKLKVIYSIITFNKNFNKNYQFLYNIKNIDKIICGSKYIYQILSSTCAKFNQNKIIFLPIGLNISDFTNLKIDKNYLSKNLIRKDQKIILFVGPLEIRKGIFIFSKMMARIIKKYKNILAVIVSFGQSSIDPKHNQNKKLVVQEIGKNNLIFLEGKQNIKQLMINSQVLLLPYENLHGTLIPPLTLLEAMACKCNIVTSNLYEIKDILGKNEGLHFKAGNIKDCLQKTEKCLFTNKYGKNAQIKVCKNYDLNQNTNKLLNIYKDLKDA